MGQSHLHLLNQGQGEWAPHSTEPNTYVNINSKQQVEVLLVSLNKYQQSMLAKRTQQNHNFIAKIYAYEPAEKSKFGKDDSKFYVYSEKTYPVTKSNWVPVTFALSILKGFRRLSTNYGVMKVRPSMIKVNANNQIRVWTNQNPIKSQPIIKVKDEEQMLVDLVKIIMQFDGPTGAFMMNCDTFNKAIDSILRNMAENKNQPNFSNRTNKNEDKPKDLSRDPVGSLPPKVNNFRSTKETEDDSLKPFNQSSFKYNPNKQPSLSSVESPKNYMQNVMIPKLPTYINVDRPDNEPKLYTYAGLKSTENDNSISRQANYSQQNNMQKQSSIQFNSSHPTKMVTTGRPYKPVQYRNQNYAESVNSQPAHPNPTYERVGRDPEKYSSKYADILAKTTQFTAYPQRKSNLNKNYLQRIETSQESLQGSDQRTKGSFGNQRSEINTSREFVQSHSFNRPRFEMDSGRTKTQQFYSISNQVMGNSPRIRTNYLQPNSQFPKSIIQASKMTSNPIQTPQSGISRVIESPKVIQVEKVRIEEPIQVDEKKQIKLKQAQKIKEQMGFLGIQNDTSKTLTNDKSARDILIKQKIEQKNKKHEQLKFAITRLLSQ